MSKDQTVTLAVPGTRRLQLRWEKPGTEAGHPGGGRAAVLLSGHGGASDGTKTKEGQHFNQALCCGLTPGLGSLCL